VSRLEDLQDDPQLEATGTVVPLPLPGHPGLRTVMNPLQIHGEEPVPPGPAPALGEHTEEVLRSLGYDDAALARLRRHGAIP
jgi:formyl-CoA transferase